MNGFLVSAGVYVDGGEGELPARSRPLARRTAPYQAAFWPVSRIRPDTEDADALSVLWHQQPAPGRRSRGRPEGDTVRNLVPILPESDWQPWQAPGPPPVRRVRRRPAPAGEVVPVVLPPDGQVLDQVVLPVRRRRAAPPTAEVLPTAEVQASLDTASRAGLYLLPTVVRARPRPRPEGPALPPNEGLLASEISGRSAAPSGPQPPYRPAARPRPRPDQAAPPVAEVLAAFDVAARCVVLVAPEGRAGQRRPAPPAARTLAITAAPTAVLGLDPHLVAPTIVEVGPGKPRRRPTPLVVPHAEGGVAWAASQQQLLPVPAWAAQVAPPRPRPRPRLPGQGVLVLDTAQVITSALVPWCQDGHVRRPPRRGLELTTCYALSPPVASGVIVVGGPYWVAAGDLWVGGGVAGDVVHE